MLHFTVYSPPNWLSNWLDSYFQSSVGLNACTSVSGDYCCFVSYFHEKTPFVCKLLLWRKNKNICFSHKWSWYNLRESWVLNLPFFSSLFFPWIVITQQERNCCKLLHFQEKAITVFIQIQDASKSKLMLHIGYWLRIEN